MKRLKLRMASKVFLASVAVLFSSCEQDSFDKNQESNTPEISEVETNKLIKLGFNPYGVTLKTTTDIDGKEEQMYEINEDILFPKEQLMRVDLSKRNIDKQFSSAYKIDVKKYPVVEVVGFNGSAGDRGLSKGSQKSLKRVIDRYNSLNTSLKFNLTFSKKRIDGGIAVYVNSTKGDIRQDSKVRGTSRFPLDDGKIGKELFINPYTNNTFNLSAVETLLAHELGHAVGLRHTDWTTKLSCSDSIRRESRISERNGDGANYILGTPGSGNDPTSTMNACFTYEKVEGELLNNFDRKTLRFLYPK